MKNIELWHEWNSVQSFKVRLVLAEKNLSWTEHRIELLKFEHLQPDYLAINPNGVVPTLAHDGRMMFESSVICQYLDETFLDSALMPRDPYSRAQARVWLKYFDDVIHHTLRQISFELLYRPLLAQLPTQELDSRLALHPDPVRAQRFRDAAFGKVNRKVIDEAGRSIRGIISRLERALEHNAWLGGEHYGMADVGMAPFVERLDHLGISDLLADSPHVVRWRNALMARAAVQKARAPSEFRLPVKGA